MSAGLHLVVLLLLIWFGPVREYRESLREKRELTLQGDQLQAVMGQVQDLQEAAIEEKVAMLRTIEEDLETMNRNERTLLREQQAEARRSGPQDALRAQEEALQKQTAALENLRAFPPQWETARQAEQPTSAETQAPVNQAMEEIQTGQAEAGVAQAEAQNAIELSGPFFAPARAAQEAAMTAQHEVDEAQTQSSAAVMTSLRAARTRRETEERVGAARQKRDQAVAALQPKQEQASRVEAEWQARVETLNQAKAAYEAARQQTREFREEVNRARQEARKRKQPSPPEMENQLNAREATSKQLDTAQREAAQAERDARKLKDQAAGEQKRAADALQRAERDWQRREEQHAQARTGADRQHAQARQALATAAQLQTTARDRQRIARDALRDLIQQLEENPERQIPEELADVRVSEKPLLTTNLNVAELYRDAVQTEFRLTETYRQVRAAELAMIQNYSFPKALAATEVAKPIRPELNEPALTNKVRNAAQLQAYKDEVTKAELTVDSMLELAVDMLVNATNLNQATEQGLTVALERISEEAEHYQQLAAAAQDDNRQRGRDLSGLMRRGDEPPAGKRPSSGGGSKPAGKSWEALPPPPPDMRNVLPARKVMRLTGDRARWIFVDSWYVIGPWPNKARVNIDTKFPPESVVDLDATYVGKRNQIIRWEFDQATEPRIDPRRDEEYAIYYAYTELYFEQPLDTWIAVGSDDKSKIWINGDLVWISANHLKSWRIDEGFRKVHFRQGRNKILYRVENGWHSTQYSLCIALPGTG